MGEFGCVNVGKGKDEMSLDCSWAHLCLCWCVFNMDAVTQTVHPITIDRNKWESVHGTRLHCYGEVPCGRVSWYPLINLVYTKKYFTSGDPPMTFYLKINTRHAVLNSRTIWSFYVILLFPCLKRCVSWRHTSDPTRACRSPGATHLSLGLGLCPLLRIAVRPYQWRLANTEPLWVV